MSGVQDTNHNYSGDGKRSEHPRSQSQPSAKQIRRWQQYLANERAEAAVYRELAKHKEGEEKDILLSIADAEARHEQHWRTLLGDEVGFPRRPDLSTRFLGFLARRFGSVFALAMMQASEARSPYGADDDATEQMRADEAIHAEVVRGLAARGRERMSGNFRAAVFGANDGLVSNLALVLGVMASGVSSHIVLITGISGLLSGALSMGAGEYISVKSQNELLEASTPHPETTKAVPQLDVDANELALVYRARGMSEESAQEKADSVFAHLATMQNSAHNSAEHMAAVDIGLATHTAANTGGAWSAAVSSFLCFGTGALIPIIPFILGLGAPTAGICALVLVGFSLMITGAITGILSGKPPLKRAMRQLLIGFAAAGVTYALGSIFGVSVA
ncbi:rubrerythrin family protein [Corynebacterium sp. sy017]|uniref:VIT1/CCC1 transporter family protein n=1 Tax=unclassified Corynebacterium TaxID=2624378 RepID=UPI00118569CA|nr:MULTISPECIES: VIT1/CCC1 transporter family protein [unclassified Corynebacterium]MBP3088058.1 rubrerythrin family protein [Corynebacterium sp. sy017]TSD92586.1 rubrerythrin family protein [Corynebacterium sp. SY003]